MHRISLDLATDRLDPRKVSKRPGGLTALAVINFVAAGIGLLSVLGLVALLKYADLVGDHASAADLEVIKAFNDLGMGLWALEVIASVLAAALLIIAGVGYLKVKPWGRVAGNLYAIISIASSVISAVLFPVELGGGFQIGTMIGFVYPVLTVILINTTFKEDFQAVRADA